MQKGALYLPFLKKFYAWPQEFDIYKFAQKHGIEIFDESIEIIENLVSFKGSFTLLNSVDYVLNEICNVGCKCCGTILSEQIKVIKAPDEHWRELLDCWTCHKESFAVATHASSLMPKDGIAFLINDSILIKTDLTKCPVCSEQVGAQESAGFVKFFVSKLTINGKNLNSEQVLVEKLKMAYELYSGHSFRICDSKGNSFGLEVTSWDSILFSPNPVHVILCKRREKDYGSEVIFIYDHDFDAVLCQIERNVTPLGLYFPKI